MHRLWYDLRTQSMFEPDLREAVLEIEGTLERMIWRVVSRYAELAGAEPAYDPGTTYAVLDGIFEKALLAHIVGTDDALPSLHRRAHDLMPTLLADLGRVPEGRSRTKTRRACQGSPRRRPWTGPGRPSCVGR